MNNNEEIKNFETKDILRKVYAIGKNVLSMKAYLKFNIEDSHYEIMVDNDMEDKLDLYFNIVKEGTWNSLTINYMRDNSIERMYIQVNKEILVKYENDNLWSNMTQEKRFIFYKKIMEVLDKAVKDLETQYDKRFNKMILSPIDDILGNDNDNKGENE